MYFKWDELKSRGLHPEYPKSVLHVNLSHDVHFKNGYEWLHKVGVMLQPKMAVSAAGKRSAGKSLGSQGSDGTRL